MIMQATIAAYMDSFDASKKQLLQDLYDFLKKHVPKEATETINYGMPTFRYHGNLIHFAMNKQHIGIYPGSAAMESFKEKMIAFKTSKGALQLPLDTPIPKQLLKEIIAFNVDKLKDKTAPNGHNHKDQWVKERTFMENLLGQTNLIKEFKWGSDIYTFNGKNVIGWGGFKDFFSLWFYNGVFLEDKEKVLISASEGKTKSLRQWRFTSIDQMNASKILAYINESIDTIKDGKEIKPEKSLPVNASGLFLEYLNKDKIFENAFQKLTPGKRKEYIEYIDTAKQEQTKTTRIEKIKPMILEGIGLNDKYRR